MKKIYILLFVIALITYKSNYAQTTDLKASDIVGSYTFSQTWQGTSGMTDGIYYTMTIYLGSNNELLAKYYADGFQTMTRYKCKVVISGNSLTLTLKNYDEGDLYNSLKVGDKVGTFEKLSNGNLKESGGRIWTKEK